MNKTLQIEQTMGFLLEAKGHTSFAEVPGPRFEGPGTSLWFLDLRTGAEWLSVSHQNAGLTVQQCRRPYFVDPTIPLEIDLKLVDVAMASGTYEPFLGLFRTIHAFLPVAVWDLEPRPVQEGLGFYVCVSWDDTGHEIGMFDFGSKEAAQTAIDCAVLMFSKEQS